MKFYAIVQFLENYNKDMDKKILQARSNYEVKNMNCASIQEDIKKVFVGGNLQTKNDEDPVDIKQWIFPTVWGFGSEDNEMDFLVVIDENWKSLYKSIDAFIASTDFDYYTHSASGPDPVLTVNHKATDTICEIALICNPPKNHDRIFKIHNWFKQDGEAVKFIIFLRNAFACSDLNGIKFYRAIDTMAIEFLQMRGYFPGFKDNAEDIKKIENYKTLVVPFFQFYMNFDWQQNFVCPFFDKDDQKSNLAYETALGKHPEMSKLNFSRPMMVIDVMDLTKNHAYSITDAQLKHFKKFCEEMDILASTYPGFGENTNHETNPECSNNL